MNESGSVKGSVSVNQENNLTADSDAYTLQKTLEIFGEFNKKDRGFPNWLEHFAQFETICVKQGMNFGRFVDCSFRLFKKPLSYHYAPDIKNEESAKAYLKELDSRKDSDVNEVNHAHKTPLSKAIDKAIHENNTFIFELLISHPKINVNQEASCYMQNMAMTNNGIMTPLYSLVRLYYYSHNELICGMIKMLLNHPEIDLNQGRKDTRPFEYVEKASDEYDNKLMDLFLKCPKMKDSINSQNKDGNNYIHIAVTNDEPYALEEILKAYPNDIDLTIKNNERKTPWDIAKENGHSDMCAIIEKHQKQYPKQ